MEEGKKKSFPNNFLSFSLARFGMTRSLDEKEIGAMITCNDVAILE